MFCYKCGTALPDDACFCFKCGTAMNINCSQPAQSQPTYSEPAYNEPAYTDQGYNNQGYNDQSYTNPGYGNQGYNDQGYTEQNYAQPTYTQPAPSHNLKAEKFGVNVVFPDGHSEIGDLYVSPMEIRFMKKSKAIRIAFGILGNAMENGKETLRLSVSDMLAGNRTRIGLNPNVYQITMRNGETYRFCPNQPKNIALLEQFFINR